MATRLGSDFDKLTVGAAISNLGDGVMGAAFPLLVASLTRDPVLVSGATLAGRLPWFLFALISGALVDRMDRRRVMVVTDLMRGVGVGVLAWGISTGDVGLIPVYLIAFGLGVAETFFDTSAEAFTPRLVSEADLPAANGRLQGIEWVGGSFVGPPIGAALFVVAASLPFFLNAASFALAALLVGLIPGAFAAREPNRRRFAPTSGWAFAGYGRHVDPDLDRDLKSVHRGSAERLTGHVAHWSDVYAPAR